MNGRELVMHSKGDHVEQHYYVTWLKSYGLSQSQKLKSLFRRMVPAQLIIFVFPLGQSGTWYVGEIKT